MRSTRTSITVCVLASLMSSDVSRADLLVTVPGNGTATPRIARFDQTTGAFIGVLASGAAEELEGTAVGADGNAYVTTNNLGGGGAYRATGGSSGWAVNDQISGSHGFTIPFGMTFGADGNMYVTSNYYNVGGGSSVAGVLRYSINGTYLGQFAATANNEYIYDLTFGPNGDLFASIGGLYGQGPIGSVRRYDGTSGALIGNFVVGGSGGLGNPTGISFGSDGNLYVGDRDNNRVLRYNGTSGAFIDTFVTGGSGGLSVPADIAFGPNGNLFVVSRNTNSVIQYAGTNGSLVGTFAQPGGSTLPSPTFLTFATVPEPCMAGLILLSTISLRRRERTASGRPARGRPAQGPARGQPPVSINHDVSLADVMG